MFLQREGAWPEFIPAAHHEVRFPKGPPDGGRQAAGRREAAGTEGGWNQGQKPCLQVSLAWCGLELTSRGAMRASLRGPPVPRVPHLVPPPRGSLPAPSARRVPCGAPGAFFWGYGRRAEMGPTGSWRGWGTAP